jgi:large subunit ribosomal protein L23
MPNRYGVVVRPLWTEKTNVALGSRGEHTFVCDPRASKVQIKDAIEELFDVRVLRVRTMVQPSKRKTLGRWVGRRPKWKKAIVTIHPDDKIEGFEA